MQRLPRQAHQVGDGVPGPGSVRARTPGAAAVLVLITGTMKRDQEVARCPLRPIRLSSSAISTS
jgi:hypothetical protein